MDEKPKNEIGWFGVVAIVVVILAVGAYFAGAR